MRIFKSIKEWFNKNHHRCSKCGSRDTVHGHKWIRGWNALCEQMYGDWGWFCHKCKKIDFETTLEEHKQTLPHWCKPYEEK